MRALTASEMKIPVGGATTALVCDTSGGDGHFVKVCQTSSNLTIITHTDSVTNSAGFSLEGFFRGITGKTGIEAKTTTTTTVVDTCTPNGECKEVSRTVSEKSSDITDGAAFDSFAGIDNGGDWGGNEWAGGDWGGGGDSFGGGGGGIGSGVAAYDDAEVKTC